MGARRRDAVGVGRVDAGLERGSLPVAVPRRKVQLGVGRADLGQALELRRGLVAQDAGRAERDGAGNQHEEERGREAGDPAVPGDERTRGKAHASADVSGWALRSSFSDRVIRADWSKWM